MAGRTETRVNLKQRPAQYALLAFISLIWGSSFILMKRGLDYFDSTEVAAFRMTVAMVSLLPIALRHLATVRKHPVALFCTGFFGNCIPAFLFALAQTEIPSSLSGMLNSLTSLFTLAMGVFFFRVRPVAAQVTGVALATIGTAGLIGFVHLFELTTYGRYSLLVVGAAFCYGTSVNIIKTYLQDVPSTQIVALSFLLTVPALTVYLVFFTDFVTQVATRPESRPGVIYIAVLGLTATSLAVILFNHLIKETTAVFASSVTYLIPIVAVGWGLVDGEVIGAGKLGYLVLVLGGVFLIHAPSRRAYRRLEG